MTLVKFAALCDVSVGEMDCGSRSLEYQEWPTCRECYAHTCPPHTAPGSLKETERDVSSGDFTEAIQERTVICVGCAGLAASL